MALDHEKLDFYRVSRIIEKITLNLLGFLREEVEHEHAHEHGQHDADRPRS